jgi:protein gp37
VLYAKRHLSGCKLKRISQEDISLYALNAGNRKMLNKQGPGKIDWTDYTYNPVTGCLHNCDYCYVKRLKDYDMRPNFHADRLGDVDRLKVPSKIFVCSTGDLFGDWVPADWIYFVLQEVKKHPEHIFQFLTKNPKRYNEFEFPANCWLGTTVDGTERTIKNIYQMITSVPHDKVKFISFEPLLGIKLLKEVPGENFQKFQWFIVGADSNRGAEKPPLIWAEAFRKLSMRLGIPLWIKDNFNYPVKIKQFPTQNQNVQTKQKKWW